LVDVPTQKDLDAALLHVTRLEAKMEEVLRRLEKLERKHE
jgi:hypothetical protein